MGKIFTQAALAETYAELTLELNKALEKTRQFVKEKTPEDTFELSKSIVREDAKKVWPIVSGAVIIEPWSPANEYANYVEYWTIWSEKNYYKNWWRKWGGSPYLTSTTWTRAFSKWKDYLENLLSKI